MKSHPSTRDSPSVEPKPTASPKTRVRLESMRHSTGPTSQKSGWIAPSAGVGRFVLPDSARDCKTAEGSPKAILANEPFHSDETVRYPKPRPDACFQTTRSIPPETARNSDFPLKEERGKAFACGRFHRRIDPKPFVWLFHEPRRANARGTPATVKPDFQTETPFIKAKDPFDLGVGEQVANVFLKASCSAASAFR